MTRNQRRLPINRWNEKAPERHGSHDHRRRKPPKSVRRQLQQALVKRGGRFDYLFVDGSNLRLPDAAVLVKPC